MTRLPAWPRRSLLSALGALTMIVGGALFAGHALIGADPVRAADRVDLNVEDDGLMLHGYDPVAYFTDGTPTEGSAELSATHDGATYHFASAANRDRFLADPEKYMPAYGGFCAFGTAMGRKFDGDPHVWQIVDGRLYLNLNEKVQSRWEKNPAGFITTADHNWPIIGPVPDATLEASPPDGVKLGAQ